MKSLLSALLLCGTFAIHAQDYSLDKKLGAENAVLVEREMGLYKHDSLQWLVNSVGQKLVSRLRNKPFDFHFSLVDSEVPNAFALPGGYIYVTRGILPLIQSEDELAGVIAHEIIHVTQRHSVKQMQKGVFTGILKLPGHAINAVTGTNVGNVLNAPIDLATGTFIAKYSRGHEKESDDYGIQLAASAGYKTDALADALERLSKEIELLTGEKEKKSYFSDHPYTPSRIANIRNAANRYKPVNPSPVSGTTKKFTRVFHGLCFGPNPEQGSFIDTLFVHPNLQFSFITPSKWVRMNKPTLVATYTEKGDALMALRMLTNEKTPHALGEEVKEKIAKAQGVQLQQASDTTVNSLPAYVLRFKSINKKDTAMVEVVWLTHDKNVYQLVAIAIPKLHTTARAALYSFKQATTAERKRVTMLEMHVISTMEGESVKQLSERSNNRLSPELLLLFNNLSAGDKLPQGKLIKIVISKPY